MLLAVVVGLSFLVSSSDPKIIKKDVDYSGQCQGRYVFNNSTYGIISNGKGQEYRENAQCEWLIQGKTESTKTRFGM